jgi:hypothetical protein
MHEVRGVWKDDATHEPVGGSSITSVGGSSLHAGSDVGKNVVGGVAMHMHGAREHCALSFSWQTIA